MPLPFLSTKVHKSKLAVGLDIGYHSIKIVVVGGVPGRQTLLHCSVSPLERVSEEPLPISEIRKTITESIGRIGLDLSDLRISVSGKGVIVRQTDMPRMNPEELKSSIRYEAEMLLPFSLDDCVFDCHILDPASKDKARMRVILAAARKAVVQERLELLKEINLVPRIIGIDSIALANAFESAVPEVKAEETVSLVHMGAVRTVLNIMSGQSLELTRDIEVGGNTATLAIARALGVSFAEAEKRKEAGDPSAKELITPLAVVLSRELRSTFSYVSSKMNKNVGKIYLSGGCAMLQGLKEVLSSDFGMEVLLWNPLQGFHPSLRAPADYVQGKEPLLAIAAGLAATD